MIKTDMDTSMAMDEKFYELERKPNLLKNHTIH